MKTNQATSTLPATSAASSRSYRKRRSLFASPWLQRGLIAAVLGIMVLSLFSGR